MDVIDYVAIVASVLSIVSFSVNVVQWVRHRHSVVDMRQQFQANYVKFYHIARSADEARALIIDPPSNHPAEKLLMEAELLVERIRGAAFSARAEIVSHCREHLGCVPFWDHPAHPQAFFLEKCRKREIVAGQATPAEGDYD